ncbi:hypothetical protein [Bacteriovorax stolpii]|uniref:hypothetical protein n=1 Tax=Bacteriovorax stolpii TaxID=960 RepID=UPI001315148A|nr:hypothetical protein [Bacteriovorax stolpii]
MVSRTCVTENRRARKAKNAGSKRKAANRNKGTTPKFAIHLTAETAPKAKTAAKTK